jgi:hypothetical protein
VTLPSTLVLTAPASDDNSTKVGTTAWVRTYVSGLTYATQSYVTTAISNLVDSSPSTLDTLNELAAALGDDPNFATTVATSIGGKLSLTGGTLTGALNGTSATFSSTVTNNVYSTPGSIANPFFNDVFLLGTTNSYSKIQWGNEFNNTYGTYLRFIVNGTSNFNTPVTALTLLPSGAATFSSSVGVGGASATYSLTAFNSSNGTTAAFGGTEYGVRIDNGGGFSAGRSTIFGVDNTFYGSYQPLSIEAQSLALNAVTGGNVGIGTDSPSGRLHVQNGVSGQTISNINNLILENNGSSNEFYVFQTATAGGGKSFSITNAGNVGIGTDIPSYSLDVSGRIRAFTASSGVSPRTDLGGTIIAEGSTRAGLYILTTGIAAGSYGSIWWGNGNTNTDAFISVENNTRAMRFGTADGTRMSILSGGNVGIFDTSPSRRLTVNFGTNVNDGLIVYGSQRQNTVFQSTGEHCFIYIDSHHANTFLPVLHFQRSSTTLGDIGLQRASNSDAVGSFAESEMVVGSLISVPFSLKTNNVRRVVIQSNGNVNMYNSLTVSNNFVSRNFNKYIKTWSPAGSTGSYTTVTYNWADELASVAGSFDSAGYYKGFIRSANGAHYNGYHFDILVGNIGYGANSLQFKVQNITPAHSPWVGGCGPTPFGTVDNTTFEHRNNPCGEALELFITKLGG